MASLLGVLTWFDWDWRILVLLAVVLAALIGVLLYLRNKRPEE